MKALLAILGAAVVAFFVYGATLVQTDRGPFFINVTVLTLGGLLGLAVGTPSRIPALRFLTGALLALLLASAALAFGHKPLWEHFQFRFGFSLVQWIVIGGGLALVVNWVFPVRKP